jgi:hypothetical protein
MKKLVLLLALAALCPSPAQASWAIALFQSHNPAVHGHRGYHVNYDDAPGALADCNKTYGTNQCKIISQGSSGCAALANNGAKGTAIRWTAGEGRRKDVADEMALKSCQAHFGGSCKVVHDFCN